MKDLNGRTAVVTGAASGMGRAFALRFARAGMNVVLADIESPPLDEAVDEVRALGVQAIGVRTDVRDATAVDELGRAAVSSFRQVHVVCNNAGVAGTLSAGATMNLEEWHWVVDVNFWGVVHGHRTFLPLLAEHGDGHIVNTASMAGHFPGHSAYGATKWAVVGVTEGLYQHLRSSGSSIGVSCLCPGWIRTNIVSSNRNAPEFGGSALTALSPELESQRDWVAAQVDGGLDPNHVADLVHDAVLNDQFWIFTHPDMVAMLSSRYDAILTGTNPPSITLR